MNIKANILIIIILNTYFQVCAQNRILGSKSYEISNHLGNVMTVVSDRKTSTPETTIIKNIAFNETDIKSSNDYYPYGMILENRNSMSEYRYRFNGMEIDSISSINSNMYNTYFRRNEVRLGKWLSTDPKVYPWESAYTSMGNNPIFFTDPFGDEIIYRGGIKGGLQKFKVFFNKLFSKSFKEKFNEYKESDIKYHLIKDQDAIALIYGGTIDEFKHGSDDYKKNHKRWTYSSGLGKNKEQEEEEDENNNEEIKDTKESYVKNKNRFNFNWPKINLPELSWGAALSVEDKGLFKHIFSYGLGDYKNYSSLFIERNGVFEYSDAVSRLRSTQFRDALIMISWHTKYGYTNWIAIGNSFELFNIQFKFQYHKYRSGKTKWRLPWK